MEMLSFTNNKYGLLSSHENPRFVINKEAQKPNKNPNFAGY